MAKKDRSIKITFTPEGDGEVTLKLIVTPEISDVVRNAIVNGDQEALLKIAPVELSQAQVLLDVVTVLNDHFARKEGET